MNTNPKLKPKTLEAYSAWIAEFSATRESDDSLIMLFRCEEDALAYARKHDPDGLTFVKPRSVVFL